MVARLARTGPQLSDSILVHSYTRQLVQVQAWLPRRPEIQLLPVSYADALCDPAGTCARLARFLGQPFDESAAATAVDSSLRRQKPPAGIPPEPRLATSARKSRVIGKPCQGNRPVSS